MSDEIKKASNLFGRDLPNKPREPLKIEWPTADERKRMGGVDAEMPKGWRKWTDDDWSDFWSQEYPGQETEDSDPWSLDDFASEVLDPAAKSTFRYFEDYPRTWDYPGEGHYAAHDDDWYSYYKRAVDEYLRRGGDPKKYYPDYSAPGHLDYEEYYGDDDYGDYLYDRWKDKEE